MNDKLVILITGCSSGFGQMMVEPLARLGHTVYATLRDMHGRNAAAAQQLRLLAGRERLPIHVLEMDVTSSPQVSVAVARIERQSGCIDVLINNAGIMAAGVTEAFDVEQFQQQLNTNVTGVFRVTQAVLPLMRRRESGLLMHMSSIAGRIALPFFGLYNASKFALEALAEAYRYELSGFGIDSVIIEPGVFDTPLFDKCHRPQHNSCVAEYGSLADTPDQLFAALAQRFADQDAASDPHLVVNAVLKLIATPAGERPLRTVVGSDRGVAELNEASVPFCRTALTNLGLAHLAELKKPCVLIAA